MIKKKKGRPSSYNKKYCQDIIDFFDISPYEIIKLKKKYKDGTIEEIYHEVANDLPLLSKFAVNINVCRDTLIEWTKKHPEFSDAYKKAKELQRTILITNGLRNNYQTAFAIFTAKNLTDMRDVQTINLNTYSDETKKKIQDIENGI
jgi:hypothetical protein